MWVHSTHLASCHLFDAQNFVVAPRFWKIYAPLCVCVCIYICVYIYIYIMYIQGVPRVKVTTSGECSLC